MTSWKTIWSDERGVIVSIELVMVATVSILGALVGLTAYRDSIVQELGDTAAGIGKLQQSFSYDAVTLVGEFVGDYVTTGYGATTDGSSYVDNSDVGEANPDPDNAAPMCIVIDASTVEEE